ncbi:glycosyltransferase [Candidatus Micrarchaeota archaeon]|nr:glycosyltransferase [Candidatus Micrarchaeota archaeon]
MKKPKISVVIPTLNEEKEIEQALESIKNQKNVPEYEIILGDSGSTDKTLDIAKKYVDQIVHESKRTIAAGRQAGALAARGEIMATANADTFYPEDWLNSLIKPFERKGVVAVQGKVLPKDGDVIEKIFARHLLHPAAYLLTRLNVHFAAAENMAVKMSEFRKCGGFHPDDICAEDTRLVQRIKDHGEIVYAPEAKAYVSMRRVRKWGKLYFTYFHTTNFLKTHFLNKRHGKYEAIRE